MQSPYVVSNLSGYLPLNKGLSETSNCVLVSEFRLIDIGLSNKLIILCVVATYENYFSFIVAKFQYNCDFLT